MKKIILVVACVFSVALLSAQTAALPVSRIALYSSGVGYFEHQGSVSGDAEVSLPFNVSAINDALKSLVVTDSGTKTPSVSYPSERTLSRALESLKIDLSGNPGVADILSGLKGEEIQINAPALITGRILSVETKRQYSGNVQPTTEEFLSLYTTEGIRTIQIKDISSFSFSDAAINADLNRALDIIMAGRDSQTKTLTISLPGDAVQDGGRAMRDVALSYVIPAPVWKVSYRLDLHAASPFIQGWAIVDNDGDTDWNDVELSLVTGRPVSFIQNLYPPYYQYRPILPLAIAGVAEARTYEGASVMDAKPMAKQEYSMADAEESITLSARARAPSYEHAPAASNAVAAGAVDTANAQALGDQFEFTFKTPVTLGRQQSAMLPLLEGEVKAEKTLVLSGAQAMTGAVHPQVSVELTNNTGMKLPAGPITVYDAGSYAGDALIEFFPENDKRIISYGDDLSVTGSAGVKNERVVSSVKISKGVMTISRKSVSERIYTVRNASTERKRLIIEHPITRNAALTEPASFAEKTDTVYRFVLNLSASSTTTLTVKEETPLSETVTLTSLNFDTLLRYTTNAEIPTNVKAALQKAIDLKLKAEETADTVKELQGKRAIAVSEQDRVRRNLEAAGNQSPQGQEYLRRLVALDDEIDSYALKIYDAEKAAQNARDAYTIYLTNLEL